MDGGGEVLRCHGAAPSVAAHLPYHITYGATRDITLTLTHTQNVRGATSRLRRYYRYTSRLGLVAVGWPVVLASRCETSWLDSSSYPGSTSSRPPPYSPQARGEDSGGDKAKRTERARARNSSGRGRERDRDGADEALRDGAVAERGARGGGAQRVRPRLRDRPRRPPHRRPQAPRLPRPQPFRPDPGAPGRGRSPLRVPRHQPLHRHQVQVAGPGPGAHAVGEAGDVAGGRVAPLLPGSVAAGVPAPHQAHHGGRARRGPRRQARRRPRQGARRLRGAPRQGRQQVPRRRRIHARRRQPPQLHVHAHQDLQGGGARRLQAARQGMVGGHLCPSSVDQDRRRHPAPAQPQRLRLRAGRRMCRCCVRSVWVCLFISCAVAPVDCCDPCEFAFACLATRTE